MRRLPTVLRLRRDETVSTARIRNFNKVEEGPKQSRAKRIFLKGLRAMRTPNTISPAASTEGQPPATTPSVPQLVTRAEHTGPAKKKLGRPKKFVPPATLPSTTTFKLSDLEAAATLNRRRIELTQLHWLDKVNAAHVEVLIAENNSPVLLPRDRLWALIVAELLDVENALKALGIEIDTEESSPAEPVTR
jgi:hypothetical protein